MDTQKRIKDIYDQAQKQPTSQRDAFINRICSNNHEQERVRAMLDTPPNTLDIIDQTDPQSPLLGQNLGPYHLLTELGRGGMGVVFKARRVDGVFDRLAAVKVIKVKQNSLITRFNRERQILADLNHPNIARLYDGGSCEHEPLAGCPYLVMEYVDGEPIDDWCRGRILTVEAGLNLFLQVCDAVAAAHRKQIIHRDIKPANVLVNREGLVKLLDFGIAKPAAPSLSSITETGKSPMTPLYAAPEQLSGDSVSIATDVFALGLLLYEILVGKAYPRIGQRIIHLDLGVVFEKNKNAALVTDALECIIFGRAMADRPGDRFESAGEFAVTIKTVLKDLDPEVAALTTPSAQHSQTFDFSLESGSSHHLITAGLDPREEARHKGWIYHKPGGFIKNPPTQSHIQATAGVMLDRGFYFAETPVTNQAFAEFIRAGGYENPRWWSKTGQRFLKDSGSTAPDLWDIPGWNEANQPVIAVSWYEAEAYCRWLTQRYKAQAGSWWRAGMRIRLPSNAMWTFAAYGPESRLWPWGEAWPDSNRAHFAADLHSGTPINVYHLPQGITPSGVMGMAGNVAEWCMDDTHTNSKSNAPNPHVEAQSPKICRGGCWASLVADLGSHAQMAKAPKHRDPRIGFRPCIELPADS